MNTFGTIVHVMFAGDQAGGKQGALEVDWNGFTVMKMETEQGDLEGSFVEVTRMLDGIVSLKVQIVLSAFAPQGFWLKEKKGLWKAEAAGSRAALSALSRAEHIHKMARTGDRADSWISEITVKELGDELNYDFNHNSGF